MFLKCYKYKKNNIFVYISAAYQTKYAAKKKLTNKIEIDQSNAPNMC